MSDVRADPQDPELDPDALKRDLRAGWWSAGPPPRYWLTRFALVRALGLIYLVAFLVSALQAVPLIGQDGLLPAAWFLDRVAQAGDTPVGALWDVPTLFWITDADWALRIAAWLGVALSLLVLGGFANAPVMGALWLLYMSFVHVGQVFYGYGWEILLLEAGFLGVFLVPARRLRPFPHELPPPRPVLWLFRWLLFRVMFGAGLIKLRGDDCWTELTCLSYHFETQPIPNPLSLYLHHLPGWVHELGVLFNHWVELVVPWGVFGPRRVRHAAGVLTIAFQLFLIVSGNLSFLNWLTLAVALACFDDTVLRRLVPRRLAARVDRLPDEPAEWMPRPRRIAVWGLVVLVAGLSVGPVYNMLSPRQRMNASFDPLHLVNTYGAFGTVGQTRYEVVLEGTVDESPDSAEWREFEFPCKPGDPDRRPCVISPYHLRLDWQMWFAALSSYRQQPWILRLAYKLLRDDPAAVRLLARDPFPGGAPRYIRASLYRYEFAEPGAEVWWRRERVGRYLPPMSEDHPLLENVRDRDDPP
jgi:hypothetical protein